MKLRLVFVLAVLLALLPTGAHAQVPDSTGFMGTIERDLTLAAGDRVGGMVVIGADAIIDGTIVDFAIIVGGTATVTGTGVVEGEITVIDGTLVLQNGALVKDISLVNSNFESATNARVTGNVDERGDQFVFEGFSDAVSIVIWLAFTVVAVAGALAFAAVGGTQLRRASTAISAELGKTLISTIFVWIVLPIISVLVIFTVIGIALSISMFLYVLPSLWFLGYIAMGTRVGIAILGLLNRPAGDHPYFAAALGVLVLQVATWIPVLGWLSAALAGVVGAGAIVLIAWRAVRGRSDPPAPAAPINPYAPIA